MPWLWNVCPPTRTHRKSGRCWDLSSIDLANSNHFTSFFLFGALFTWQWCIFLRLEYWTHTHRETQHYRKLFLSTESVGFGHSILIQRGSRTVLWFVGHRWFHRKLLRAFGHWRCSLDFPRCGPFCEWKKQPWLFRSFFFGGEMLYILPRIIGICYGNPYLTKQCNRIVFFFVAQGGFCCLFRGTSIWVSRNQHLGVGSSSRYSWKVSQCTIPGQYCHQPPSLPANGKRETRDVEMDCLPTGSWMLHSILAAPEYRQKASKRYTTIWVFPKIGGTPPKMDGL